MPWGQEHVGLLKPPKRKERPQDDAQTLALLEKIKARRSDFTFIGRYKVVEISTGIEWCVAAVTAPEKRPREFGKMPQRMASMRRYQQMAFGPQKWHRCYPSA